MQQKDWTPRQIVNELDYLDTRSDQLLNTVPFPAETYGKVKSLIRSLTDSLLDKECTATSWTISVTIEFIVEWDF